MFVSKKIGAYVQAIKFHGKDAPALRFQIYITPLSYGLACELSPKIADSLFRKAGKGFVPALELSGADIILGEVPLQAITWHQADDEAMDHIAVLTQNVVITDLSVAKLFTDDPNFSLIFNADFPVDEITLKLAHQYFRKKMHLTFEDMQPSLFKEDAENAIGALCEICQKPARWIDSEKSFFCGDDVRKGKGTVTEINEGRKETPKQVEARLKREKAKAAAAADNGDDD